MREDDARDLKRGTRITLHLKQDATDLADAEKLGALIKQYSEFIQFPIKLWASKTDYEQVQCGCSACVACLLHTAQRPALILFAHSELDLCKGSSASAGPCCPFA